MNVAGWGFRSAQLMMFGSAVVLSTWVGTPWSGLIPLVFLCLHIAVVQVIAPAVKPRFRTWLMVFPWFCTAGVAASLPAARNFTIDSYYGVVALLVAAGVLAGFFSVPDERLRNHLKALGMNWAFLGCLGWIAGSYKQNLNGPFYFGMLGLLLLLVALRAWFRLGTAAIQVVHCLALLVIGLPVVDYFYRPSQTLDAPMDMGRNCYSYEAAKRDPAAFSRWWRHYLDQWQEMGKDVFTGDPDKVLPFRLKPGGRGYLFRSPVSINSLGFRGPEFARQKADVYRIVALGESTTFGCTLGPGDRPWPEVLEQIIREQLGCKRRVEVINAGVPAYNLRNNLHRLVADVLPLKPDMVISYHGANGFRMLDGALPSFLGAMPVYRERPVKLLADCEYRLKVVWQRRQQTPAHPPRQPSFADVMNSKYANTYRELIHIAQTNSVRLVLANFSMAVNSRSAAGPVEFYGSTFPGVKWHIKANEAHSKLVEELAKQNPGCVFVDTQRDMDGEHEKFIDLVHLTQAGRQQLAENIFAGIRKALEEDLNAGAGSPAL